MKRQLSIKELAPYLPYGLKMYDKRLGEIVPLLGIESDTYNFKGGEDEYDWWNISAFKPLLRPLSDLTKTIVHNGEEFVPIVKIAEILNLTVEKFEVDGIIGYGWDEQHIDDSQGFEFNWSDKQQTFAVWYDSKDGDPIYTIGGYNEIQKLLEWHFDIFSLIDSNLALDINQQKYADRF